MKKYIFIIFLILITLGIILFVIFKDDSLNENNNEDNSISNNKGLVLYFSATGTTKNIAKTIADITESDIIEIIPKEKYSTDDLNYTNNNSRANIEQKDSLARPEIDNDINVDKYDRIYLGYPIWWGTNPKIILTLLDKYNFDNKEVVLFCTSGSTGIEESMNNLKKYNSNMNILDAKRFSSSSSKEEISEWINSIESNITNVYVKVNNHILTIDLENNSSSEALVNKLKENDITINMEDYGNFEKVGDLGFSLPTNDKKITTTYGDVILYQGNKITIYYDTNSWNFTKLGYINNISQSELKKILGKDDVVVTLSLKK